MEVAVRRPICLVATVVATGSLVAGVGIASAAGSHPAKPKKVKPVMLRCHMSLSTAPPPGSNSVDQPPSQGKQYGPVGCPTKSFGSGLETDSFTVPDSGDTVGSYVQYFHGGSVKGTFHLVPQEGTTSDTGFTSETWTGTVTVTGGTALYKGISGKKSTGVLNCTSPDTVHLSCTEKIKVVVPPPKPSTGH
jgi:hypothetical protein